MDTNIPQNDALESAERKEAVIIEKLKDHGRKGLTPLINLVHKYRKDLIPYIEATEIGLSGAVNVLDSGQEAVEKSRPVKVVSGWFQNAQNALSEIKQKLEDGNPQEIIEHVESLSEKNPSMMFSASYLTGLFLGNVGRHLSKRNDQGVDYGTKH